MALGHASATPRQPEGGKEQQIGSRWSFRHCSYVGVCEWPGVERSGVGVLKGKDASLIHGYLREGGGEERCWGCEAKLPPLKGVNGNKIKEIAY